MILLKRNIELKITQEEFAYGMGFIIDSHFKTDWTSDWKKDKFPNKHYVGGQLAGGKFAFEDKNMSGKRSITYSDIFTYEAENKTMSYIQLRLVLKEGWFILALISLTIFNILPYTFFEPRVFKFLIPFMTGVVVLASFIFILLGFGVAKKEIKKQIETRLRIREYHQQKNK